MLMSSSISFSFYRSIQYNSANSKFFLAFLKFKVSKYISFDINAIKYTKGGGIQKEGKTQQGGGNYREFQKKSYRMFHPTSFQLGGANCNII